VPTLDAVAALAGVGRGTASRVINGGAKVSERARQAVEDAIDQLGYVPNAAARTLKQKTSRVVGVVVSDLGNQFYARLAAGIEQALRRGGDFLLYDGHPVAGVVDSFGRWQDDYFDESVQIVHGWTHFELEGPPPREEKHERFWRLGQIVSAVARAGLVVRALEEYPGTTSWRRLDRRIPGTFLLHARKP
jgi:hypothetical protein